MLIISIRACHKLFAMMTPVALTKVIRMNQNNI